MRLFALLRVCSVWMVPLALVACGSLRSPESLFGLVTPYRVEIVQGNVVTQEMAALIKPGLSRSQVRDALGSPLLTDIFHADRWDYVFTIRRQGAPYQQRRVTVLVEGDSMKAFEADELPSERDFVASIDTSKLSGNLPTLALTDAQLQALPLPPKPSASAAGAEPQGPARSYPPLEATR